MNIKQLSKKKIWCYKCTKKLLCTTHFWKNSFFPLSLINDFICKDKEMVYNKC